MDQSQSSLAGAGVQVGDVLERKYRVERILGVGGMGVVVAAHHLQLDVPVAIKFLLPNMTSDAELVQRFEREARAAARIASEHVARVFDVSTLSNGAPYIVMEFLEGEDLGAWLRARGPLPIEQAVEFVLQACVAVGEAHALGIVHRDLKPSNLFCVRRSDGSTMIKLLDFGISKIAEGPGGVSSTRTTTVLGTPLYMSPEQLRSSKDVDGRTDIWSMGVILYELLTALTPFSGDTMPEVCIRIATEPPPPLRVVRPNAPEALEAVIRRCLEKDRDRRFRSVVELVEALLPFAPRRAHPLMGRAPGGLPSSTLAAPESAPQSLPRTFGLPPQDTGVGVGQTTPGLNRSGGKVALAVGGVIALAVVAVATYGFAVRPSAKEDPASGVAVASPVKEPPGTASPVEPSPGVVGLAPAPALTADASAAVVTAPEARPSPTSEAKPSPPTPTVRTTPSHPAPTAAKTVAPAAAPPPVHSATKVDSYDHM